MQKIIPPTHTTNNISIFFALTAKHFILNKPLLAMNANANEQRNGAALLTFVNVECSAASVRRIVAQIGVDNDFGVSAERIRFLFNEFQREDDDGDDFYPRPVLHCILREMERQANEMLTNFRQNLFQLGHINDQRVQETVNQFYQRCGDFLAACQNMYISYYN